MSTVKRNEPRHSDFNENDNKIIKQLLHNSDGRTTLRKIFRIKIQRPFTEYRPRVLDRRSFVAKAKAISSDCVCHFCHDF